MARSAEFPSSQASRSSFGLLMAGVLMFAACGGSPEVTPDLTQRDADTAAPDAAPDASDADTNEAVANTCESNRDCDGGEVCRDGLCRTACAAAEDCPAELPVCDTSLGYCVECATDDECATHEACTKNTCTFFCRDNSACGPTQYCKIETGLCIERECDTSANCEGGFRCVGFECLPIDDLVCDPDTTVCSGDGAGLLECNADGTVQTTTPCGEAARCVTRDGVSACAPIVCNPFELGCTDDGTAFECDATGTLKTDTACGAGNYCEAGACQPEVCEPDSVTCRGAGLATCDGRGASETFEACDLRAECSGSPFGCACDAGDCLPRLCVPGSTRCAATGVQTCAADGLSWSATAACTAGQTCIAALGACATIACTANSRECVGDVLATCDATGTTRTTTSCRDQGQICTGLGAAAACTARVCQPGALTCSADGTSVIECDARGATESVTACPGGQVCSQGGCVAQVCSPGQSRCTGGTLGGRETCAPDGLSWEVSNCAADASCASGICQTRICTPGATRCVAGSLTGREVCAVDGLSWRAAACASSETCTGSGTCTAQVCAPGTTACVGASSQRTCAADGLSYGPAVACTAGASCSTTTGMCTNWSCTPNLSTCLAGSNMRHVCNADGLGYTDTACDARTTCVAGLCAPWACTPGEFSCTDVNTRRVCNADGLGYSSAQCSGTAANGYSCTGSGTCTERSCVPGSNGPICASMTEKRVCSADGQGYTTASCAANESCSAGACKTRICTPDATRCTGGALAGREVCAADGLSWTASSCGASETCTGSGTCTAQICTPGSNACVGSSSQRTCAADGLSYLASVSCGARQSCSANTGTCTNWTCEPGNATCLAGSNTRHVCNADGLGYSDTACGAQTTCSAGLCKAWVCTPGEFSCTDVNNRRVCNADGLGYSSAQCSGTAANGYSCTGSGTCTERVCTPGSSTNVCASTTSRQTCASDGLGYTTVACSAGQSCSTGTCAVRCGDGLKGGAEACDDGNLLDGDTCGAACEISCSGVLDACSGGCHDLVTSEMHCGECGWECGQGETCQDGSCASTCNVLNFDGVNDYASSANTSGFSYGAAYTIEAWFNADKAKAYSSDNSFFEDTIFLHGGCCGGIPGGNFYNFLWLDTAPSVPVFKWMIDLGSYKLLASIPTTFSAWHHVAVQQSATSHSVYLDGQLVASGTGQALPGAGGENFPLQFGGSQANSTKWSFGGMLGPQRVSSVVRYQGSFVPTWTWVNDSSTIALYKLDEGTGSMMSDASDFSRDLSISGAQWATSADVGFCDGSCQVLASSETHCGSCNNPCAAGEVCQSGTCKLGQACSDGTVEKGSEFWMRGDIAFCATANGLLPADLTAARAMCGEGWHLCSAEEFVARNDNCPPHAYRFSAVLDSGSNCMMHDSGDACPNCWQCNLDAVRTRWPGTCSGARAEPGMSMSEWSQNSSGPAPHGSLCCR